MLAKLYPGGDVIAADTEIAIAVCALSLLPRQQLQQRSLHGIVDVEPRSDDLDFGRLHDIEYGRALVGSPHVSCLPSAGGLHIRGPMKTEESKSQCLCNSWHQSKSILSAVMALC